MATAPKAASKSAVSKNTRKSEKPSAEALAKGTQYKNKSGIFTLINGQLFNEAGERTTAAAEKEKGGQLKRVRKTSKGE